MDDFIVDSRDHDHFIDEAIAGMTGAPVRRAMTVLGLHAEGITKERFVPVKDGTLQASITGRPDDDGQGFELRTNGVPYAIAQETNFDFQHPNQGPTGERGADYIGRGMRETAEQSGEVLVQMHEEIFGGGEQAA